MSSSIAKLCLKAKICSRDHQEVCRLPADLPISDVLEGVQRRYAKAMADYCAGALTHVEDFFVGRIPTLEEFLKIRQKSAAVRPIFHLVEYAHGIDVPDCVFDHHSIQELNILGIDLVAM